MNVLALNFGGRDCASSFYRIWQYQKPLQELGITLEGFSANAFSEWNRVGDFDVVIVQKKLFSLGLIRKLRGRAKKLIYDVDDAIWHPQHRPHHFLTRWRTAFRLGKIVQCADLCTPANAVLAGYLRPWSRKTSILPMALDQDSWPVKSPSSGAAVRIGWSGAPVNLQYLEAIEASLVQVQQANPNVEFVIFSGQRPRFAHGLNYTFVPYQPGREAETVRGFDIGLLPLPASKFAEGKSPIKGLQYLASGLPAVVSPLGATGEMFQEAETALFARSESEWVETLNRLVRRPELRRALGQRARERFEATHALDKTTRLFANLLRAL